METKFTKKEWAWQKFGNQYMLTAQHGMRSIIIGTVRDRQNTMVHSVATNVDGILQPITPDNPDAKLIAAAPELFEVVSAILLEQEMRIETGLPLLTDTLIEIAKAAIKKATV